MKRISVLPLIACLLFSSCNSYTEKRTGITTNQLPNGKKLSVEKTSKETTEIGIITNHNYGTTHTFTYKVSINKNEINWDGGSAEPKYILFCKDTTYIRYLEEKRTEIEYKDSLSNSVKSNSYYEIKEFYQKLVDKRYFFKLFGKQYWINIPADAYNSKKKFCDEYIIPNDNELTLKPTSTDSTKK